MAEAPRQPSLEQASLERGHTKFPDELEFERPINSSGTGSQAKPFLTLRIRTPHPPFELPCNKSLLTHTSPPAILVCELTSPLRKAPLPNSLLFNRLHTLVSRDPATH